MQVVVNKSYGSFSLSVAARNWLVERGWAHAHLLVETVNMAGQKYYELETPGLRHDPMLARCVRELGPNACGPTAVLRIEPSKGPYRIENVDGRETVVEVEDVYGYTDADVENARRVAARDMLQKLRLAVSDKVMKYQAAREQSRRAEQSQTYSAEQRATATEMRNIFAAKAAAFSDVGVMIAKIIAGT